MKKPAVNITQQHKKLLYQPAQCVNVYRKVNTTWQNFPATIVAQWHGSNFPKLQCESRCSLSVYSHIFVQRTQNPVLTKCVKKNTCIMLILCSCRWKLPSYDDVHLYLSVVRFIENLITTGADLWPSSYLAVLIFNTGMDFFWH